jgi:hypothetical protein
MITSQVVCRKKGLRKVSCRDESKVGANIKRKSGESCLHLLESDEIGIPSDLVNNNMETQMFVSILYNI